MDEPPVMARRLREARKRLGVSQERLGVLAGIDEFSASARINQYERGKHVPAFEVARSLARALDVPTEYLYAEDERTARLLLAFHKLPTREKTRLVESLEKRDE